MADTQPEIIHPDSIETQDPNQTTEPKTKSRRPANTAFRQQRLKAWQPILTPKTVLPLFFAIGIIFAPIGGGLLYASAQVQEIILDYTNCRDAPTYPTFGAMSSGDVTSHFKKDSAETYIHQDPMWSQRTVNYTWGPNATLPTTQCVLQFSIDSNMTAPVLFYYKLTNFYQNHRRYAKSFNTDQLSGKAVSASSIGSSDCSPLTTVTDANGYERAYYPCGLAPNSVFNDTFESPQLLNSRATGDNTTDVNAAQTYEMNNQTGIAWNSDKELYGDSAYSSNWSDVVVPPNWVLRYPDGYTTDYHPDLVNDESFQVWMRLAGLPTFSKLAQRNDNETMVAGTYQVNVNYNFNVSEYGGTKSIIISTATVMGGKNPFLGIAYVVVGGICIVLGALFTVTHLIKPRKLGDHTYLSWNNETPSTATTSGRDGGMATGGGDSHA